MKQIEALQTQFGAMRERTVAAEEEVERLKETNQKQYDEGYAHGLSARLGPSFEYVCELRADVEMLKEAQAEVERLRGYEQTHIENLNAVREKLLLSDVTLQFVSVALGGPDEWSTHETMISSVRRTAEAAKAEVERLTKERDTYKASWEQLTVEKAQSSWGEFRRQGKMLKEVENLRDSWKERAEALEAQVKRLLAKDGKRIGKGLVRCTYPGCDCPVSFPDGYRPSVETECPRQWRPTDEKILDTDPRE